MKSSIKLILKTTVSCGFPLSWVNNQEVIELFNFLNPHYRCPSTEHPAINSDGKWKLETMLENNMPCPF